MSNANIPNETLVQIINSISALTRMVENQNKAIGDLYQNYNVQSGWNPPLNKDKINYMLEFETTSGVTQIKRTPRIIVSLTSFPERMYDIKYTLYSLLHQTVKPDEIILWLAREQFPNLESDIAPSILKLKENGLSIMWCENLKSYKKIIPALKAFPDDIIITADDDIYYPENWLELLYQAFLSKPNHIHCHRAHRVILNNHQLAPYAQWPKELPHSENNTSPLNFFTSGGGVLFPPHSLHKDTTNISAFMQLAPDADDIWLWAMALLNNTSISIVEHNIPQIQSTNYARELGFFNEHTLATTNTGAINNNDTFLQNILNAYPQLIEKLMD